MTSDVPIRSDDRSVDANDALARLAEQLRSADGEFDVHAVLSLAVASIPHADHIGLAMLESGEPERDLVDGRPLTEGYGSDGCAADPGSPTPVESLFAIRMAVDEHRLAALTFYADRPDAFDDEDVAAGSVLAGLIGTALQRQAANNKVERLEKALDSARIVGTAVGIVMAKRLLTSEQAFDQLRETSARLHRSLDDVAQAVSDTGDLPTC